MSLSAQWLTSAEDEQRWISNCVDTALPSIRIAVCEYSETTLLLPARQAADTELAWRAQRLGLSCLRRAGGGAAVLAGPWMVSAHVWVPADLAARCGLNRLRRQFSVSHQQALGALGVYAAAVLSDAPPSPDSAWLKSVCFGQANTDELVDSAGRKIVGISQHKARSGIWMGAGILVGECNWPLLATALALPDGASEHLRLGTAACGAPAQRLLTGISSRLIEEFGVLDGAVQTHVQQLSA